MKSLGLFCFTFDAMTDDLRKLGMQNLVYS
jgi:hypothetical protein